MRYETLSRSRSSLPLCFCLRNNLLEVKQKITFNLLECLKASAGTVQLHVGLANGLDKHEGAPCGLWTLAWPWSLVQELMGVKLHFTGSRRCCLNVNTTQQTSCLTDVETEAQKGRMPGLGGAHELPSRMWSSPYAVTPGTTQGRGACPGLPSHTYIRLLSP